MNHVPNVVKRNALAMQSASRHVLRGKTVDANGSGSLRSQRKSWTGWINAQKQHQNHTFNPQWGQSTFSIAFLQDKVDMGKI